MLFFIIYVLALLRDFALTLVICVIVGVAAYQLCLTCFASQYPVLHNPIFASLVGALGGGFVNAPLTWLVKYKKKRDE